MFIYKITNLINNKIYIGLTRKTVEKRWKWHLNASNTKNYYIARAIRKHKKENFKIEEIDKAYSIKELKSKEKYWIAKYQSNNSNIGYNLSDGGEFAMLNDSIIIKTIEKQRKYSNNKYIGVYWSEERKTWFAEVAYKNKSKRIRGFNSEFDAAIARDILTCELWKNSNENFQSILNFPENYEKYLNDEIEYPKRNIKIAYKKSKYHFVQWDKKQNLWYITILYGIDKKEKFKKGMYATEEQAAQMADYYNLMYLNDLNRINFKDKIEYYKSKEFIPITSVLYSRKSSPYKWISFLNKLKCYSVDVRLLKIRKLGFKTSEEAKQYRDIELKKLKVKIPD